MIPTMSPYPLRPYIVQEIERVVKFLVQWDYVPITSIIDTRMCNRQK